MKFWGALACVAVCACGRQNFNENGDGGAGGDGPTTPATAKSTLRLNRVTNTENHDNFPILVTLDDTRADRSRMLPDAKDLVFRDSAGNRIPHEIDTLGAPGGEPMKIWVRVPQVVGVTTAITVEYGSSAVAPADKSVWNEQYEAVWHMDGTGDVTDATPHQHFGAAMGTAPLAGVVGGSRAFDAIANAYVRVPDGATIAVGALTASGWYLFMSPSRTPSQVAAIIGRQRDNGFDDDFTLSVNGTAAMVNGSNDAGDSRTATGNILSMGWHYLAVTYESPTLRLYVDGNEDSMATLSGEIHTTPNPIFIGAGRNTSTSADKNIPDADFADGAIDEVRLQNEARSAGWMAFEYASMMDQVITYGPIEEL